MKMKFEIGDRVIYKPQNYVGTICGIDRYTGIYSILYDGADEEYSVHENEIEFENPKLTFLARLQELLETFDAKICSCAEGCDTSWIDMYLGENCVAVFGPDIKTESATITANNVFDYDND